MALLYSAATIAGTECVVSTICNAVIRNLCPSCSAGFRLPDALVTRFRISGFVGLHIDDPHIHLVASWHHGKLSAINQTATRIRTGGAIRGGQTGGGLRTQAR